MDEKFVLVRHDIIRDIGNGNIAKGTSIVNQELREVRTKLRFWMFVYLIIIMFCVVMAVGMAAESAVGRGPRLGHASLWFVTAWPVIWWTVPPLAIAALAIFPGGEHIGFLHNWMKKRVDSLAPHIAASMTRYQTGEWEFESRGKRVPQSLFESIYAVLLASDVDWRFWRRLPRAESGGLAHPDQIYCRRIAAPAEGRASQSVTAKSITASATHDSIAYAQPESVQQQMQMVSSEAAETSIEKPLTPISAVSDASSLRTWDESIMQVAASLDKAKISKRNVKTQHITERWNESDGPQPDVNAVRSLMKGQRAGAPARSNVDSPASSN